MRLLLTGATGFVGSHAKRALTKDGHEVHCISRAPGPSSEQHWHRLNLADAEETSNLVERVRPDQIIHLAGEVTGSRDVAAIQTTLTGNLISTVNLLTAAQQNGTKRVIIAGSMEEARLEDGETQSSSPYSASKTAAGLYSQLFQDLYEVETIHLRLFMIYGPDQPDRMKFVPYVIDECIAGHTPKLSSGIRSVDWIFVEDVVSALCACVKATEPADRPFDIGSGQLHSLKQVAEKISDLIPGEHELNFDTNLDRKLDRVRKADISYAKDYLNWLPLTSLETGLAKTIEWHQNNPLDAE